MWQVFILPSRFLYVDFTSYWCIFFICYTAYVTKKAQKKSHIFSNDINILNKKIYIHDQEISIYIWPCNKIQKNSFASPSLLNGEDTKGFLLDKSRYIEIDSVQKSAKLYCARSFFICLYKFLSYSLPTFLIVGRTRALNLFTLRKKSRDLFLDKYFIYRQLLACEILIYSKYHVTDSSNIINDPTDFFCTP